MTTINDKEELCGLEVRYLPFHPGTAAHNTNRSVSLPVGLLISRQDSRYTYAT